MNPPPTFTPAPRRAHRKRRAATPATPPAALTLLEAAFDEVAQTLRLTFDRAIDVVGLAAGQLVVSDGSMTGTPYEGAGPGTLDGPAAVVIALLELGPTEDPGTLLTATASTGIVAVDDGGAWAGVTDLPLPFP